MIALSRLLYFVLATLLAAPPGLASCADDTLYLRGEFGTAQFRVELADTVASRARGLMFREDLPLSSGMLFVYPRPQRVAFWMRNTLIPLDMIFIDATGTVRRVHSNAVPHDETPIPGGPGILAVLEINGGLARRLGLAPGVQVRHPALPQALAVWPC